jgi:hypothetical protein
VQERERAAGPGRGSHGQGAEHCERAGGQSRRFGDSSELQGQGCGLGDGMFAAGSKSRFGGSPRAIERLHGEDALARRS